MKKISFSLVFIILLMVCATAQNKDFNTNVKFGIGGVIGVPLGTYKQVEGIAYEASILAEFPVAKTVNITGNVSYFSVTGKNGVTIDGGAIPILAGAKFMFTSHVYGHAQIGVSVATESGGNSAFTYSPSVGYNLSNHFDLSLKYFAASNNKVTESYLGLRVGLTL